MAAITDLSTASSVGASDYLVISQSGTDKKVTSNKLAIVGAANTFTKKQTVAPDSNTVGVEIDMPAGSVTSAALYVTRNSGAAVELAALSSGYNYLRLYAGDNGTNGGQFFQIGRNSSGSTPAAANIALEDKGGTYYFIWPDDSGNLRIYTGEPTNANDTSGTVVGTQTSSLDSKNVLGTPEPIDSVLAAVAAGAEAVRRFTYKSGAFGGEEFSGVVVDYAPRYGMDRDAEHPAGKALNVVTVIGDLLLVVNDLAARVAALEAKAPG